MANEDRVVTEADVRAAHALLDALADPGGEDHDLLTEKGRLRARGMIAGHLADVRTAGYLEGVQRGRQEAAHVVLDALQGEGLFTTNTPAGEGW